MNVCVSMSMYLCIVIAVISASSTLIGLPIEIGWSSTIWFIDNVINALCICCYFEFGSHLYQRFFGFLDRRFAPIAMAPLEKIASVTHTISK